MVSTHLIDKFRLPTIQHPLPYSFLWLKKDNEVHMTKPTSIAYSIGNFKDEVSRDVLPMDACHILLNRAWQFEKSVIQHGKTNTYSFKVKGCSYT